MWTANVDKTGIENDKFVLYLTLTNDKNGERRPIILPLPTNLTAHNVNEKIQAQLDSLNNIDTIVQYPVGPFVPEVPPPPPVIPPLTDDQKRAAAYTLGYVARQSVLLAVSIGALDANDPMVQSSLSLITSGFSLVKSSIADKIATAQQAIDAAPR